MLFSLESDSTISCSHTGTRFDSSGNVVEHYSDGDLVNNRNTVSRERAAPDTIAVWGPNVTVAFLTGRIEDISKGAAVPH